MFHPSLCFHRQLANLPSLKRPIFKWSHEARQAFENFKRAMTEASVFMSSDFNLPFTLETNALQIVMGAVLQQKSHPISYFSKVFCLQLQRASIYIRELHVITLAVHKWRHYCLGHQFIILTDHKILKDLISQVIQTLKQQSYLSKLLGYDYSIQYRPGFGNAMTDALSHIPSPEG